MNAQIKIEVENRQQAKAVRLAVADPLVRAFLIVVGTLEPLSLRARERVLNFCADSARDHDAVLSPARAGTKEEE